MTTWKTKNIYVDLETGEIIDIIRYKAEYRTVIIRKKTYQPNKTKAFIIKINEHLCRKKDIQTNLFQIKITEQKKGNQETY